MASARQLLIPVVVLIVGPLLLTQSTAAKLPSKPRELVLEIVPAKQAYLVGEAVIVKYRFTNRSDKTVCFPPPDIETADEASGYVRTSATDGKGDNTTLFVEGFYPRGLIDQQLLNEANENWIKLAPGLSYVTGAVRPLGSLSTGDWKLQSKICSPRIFTAEQALVTDALSCTPPQVSAVSKPVNLIVITNSGSQ